MGEARFAEIEDVRQALDGSADDAVRFVGLNLAGDPNGQRLYGAAGREGVEDVAERVLAAFRRPSALGSILQRSTCCPSWSRGVRRRCWMRPRTGRS